MKFLALLAILMTLALSGCETMEGLGRDIQKAGGALEGSASGEEEEKEKKTE